MIFGLEEYYLARVDLIVDFIILNIYRLKGLFKFSRSFQDKFNNNKKNNFIPSGAGTFRSPYVNLMLATFKQPYN
jgi:hypothetical protein